VSIGVKEGAGIPIVEHGVAHSGERRAGAGAPAEGSKHGDAIRPDDYANPLPHVLMLTAIVVGVGTLGVGLAIAQKIYREYGSLEEDEILQKITAADD
jgi:multicomponent Na+:H+ antiporter subunit C